MFQFAFIVEIYKNVFKANSVAYNMRLKIVNLYTKKGVFVVLICYIYIVHYMNAVI